MLRLAAAEMLWLGTMLDGGRLCESCTGLVLDSIACLKLNSVAAGGATLMLDPVTGALATIARACLILICESLAAYSLIAETLPLLASLLTESWPCLVCLQADRWLRLRRRRGGLMQHLAIRSF